MGAYPCDSAVIQRGPRSCALLARFQAASSVQTRDAGSLAPPSAEPTLLSPRQHFKQLVEQLEVKGVGIVDQALNEAFQILKKVPAGGEAWRAGGSGGSAAAEAGTVLARSD